ncbi:MAG: transposase [Euryarchaeota archaeon]|nr:transposase [Euryarchaeota archaeon]
MKVNRTEQVLLPASDNLSHFCHLSKNLFNEGNYIIRQELNNNNKWTRFNDLNEQLNKGVSDNYTLLPSQTANRALYTLDKSWKAFFKAVKEYSKNPGKFLGRPKPPQYKPKNGEHILIFTSQQVKLKNGYLLFPKMTGIDPIKVRLGDDTKLKEVRILPRGTGYVCEIVYEKDVESLNLNHDNVAGIDLGLNNIVTMANNIGEEPIVIKGGFVKSMNQYYNKKRAEIRSIYDLQGIKTGLKMQRLDDKRNRKMKDAMHKISRLLINYCIEHNIGTLVIGHNENWKQKIIIGRRNNQNFVSIPYYVLIHDLTYKGEEVGIDVIEQEEAHTSKCSFLDDESIGHHAKYVGKRIKRGMFRSAKGVLINADVQGALNIIKKAIPKAFSKENADRIEGVGLHPRRVNLSQRTLCDTNFVQKEVVA